MEMKEGLGTDHRRRRRLTIQRKLGLYEDAADGSQLEVKYRRIEIILIYF